MTIFQQDRCLYCHNVIAPNIGWIALFSKEKEQLLCPTCEEKLEEIKGETCRICSRPFHHLNEQFRDGDLCHDCTRWEEDPDWQGFLERNHSLYLYNDFLKELIATYKFRGDYVLARIFAELFKKEIPKIDPDLLVPIPLSEERLYERGFNQATAIITLAVFPSAGLLTRIHSEKQSKKSRAERIHIPQVFKVDSDCEIEGKRILLIDDIYTTGSTLRHAAKLLKQAGAASIQSFTIAR
ncbi:amidophosphoribosyltransferase [Bacillus sp. AFS076308]|uniref:ComF family protein n=1 Tax=unclassified Bacillus (in: firmicutes) TaxID=185979 RepID=UPI000BF4C8C8|nr:MULTISPECIES: ComF family protein [unclassified Bacillus (in: firmicutes)]PFO00035.1 amidophosphoribosyltransferase [Bacillus sp. AFS076308]PGV51521.1 amidophosphoribosyltransferase [Bacillus sp. AFS037270]